MDNQFRFISDNITWKITVNEKNAPNNLKLPSWQYYTIALLCLGFLEYIFVYEY